MILTVNQLKEKLSCPIQLKLLQSGQKDNRIDNFKKIINLLAIWLDKRGAPMPMSVLETYIIKNFMGDPELVFQLQEMAEQFWYKLYIDMESPIAAHKIEVEFGDHSLADTVPILDRTKDKVKAYIFGPESDPSKLLFNRFLSVWAYYSIGLKIETTVININFDNKTIKTNTFVPSKNYVDNSSNVIHNMFKFVDKKITLYPSEETCLICPAIKYCTM